MTPRREELIHRAAVWLVHHGPLRHRATRKALVRAARRTLEAAGSERLSKPGNYGLDDRLAPFLGDAPGVFVEVGANDGYTQSNTYFLERCRGWTGVLIEAIPELYEICKRERKRSQVFNCALVAPGFEASHVRMLYGDLVSLASGTRGSAEADELHRRIHGAHRYEIDVPARTLSSVLDEAGVQTLDLVVVDVEGAEADVLRGLDLERFQPRCVLVEIMDENDEPAIAEILGDAYGPGERLTRDDVVYVRRQSAGSAPTGVSPGSTVG